MSEPREQGPSGTIRDAVEHLRAGRVEKAERICRAILMDAPAHADALHFLGVLRYRVGAAGEAIDLIQSALTASPDYADAHNNLGNILLEQGDPDGAALHYRRAVALRPGMAEAHANLGAILRAQGMREEAEASCRTAIALRPDHAEAHCNLGNVLRDRGKLAEALSAWRRALEIRPGLGEARRSMGMALGDAGRTDDVIRVFEDWRRAEPGNPVPRYLLTAATGRESPDRAPDEYVRAEFDAYAQSFDAHLEKLGYRGPEILTAELRREIGEPSRSLAILDAGCGTGLAGERLRPYAVRLTGVDLSPGMLERASARGHYDDLAAAELTAYLESRPGAFDLVFAADTLVYFGDLAPVLAATAGSLRPEGVLVTNLEEADDLDEGRGFRIRPHGRFCHTEAYVLSALDRAGLALGRLARDVLRKEGGRPVEALLVTARKPAAP